MVESSTETKKMPRNKQTVSLNAVRAELGRQNSRRRADDEVERMREFARRISALPLLDPRSADEILGYGPEGYLVGD
jgi:hypothetical protein